MEEGRTRRELREKKAESGISADKEKGEADLGEGKVELS